MSEVQASHCALAEPERVLGALDPASFSAILSAAADVMLVLDAKGIIEDIACADPSALPEGFGQWRGNDWLDTVTVESRDKLKALLSEAGETAPPRWRQVNHPARSGESDIPIRYTAMRLGRSDRFIAIGREMRAIAKLQQRLVDAQQFLERDYERLRQAEMRYRLLFQQALEAVLVIDSASHRIIESNPAAAKATGLSPDALAGKQFPESFRCSNAAAVHGLFANLLSRGSAEPLKIAMGEEAENVYLLSGSPVRSGNDIQFLLRLTPQATATAAAPEAEPDRDLRLIVERMPDAFVVTDEDGRIILANRAFLDLAQLASEGQVRGESLTRWLGRPGVDMSVMQSNLRQHGTMRMFQTQVRGEYGSQSDVEISAVQVAEAERPCMAFTIRNVGTRLRERVEVPNNVPRSVEQLTELVGRLPLRDLVREATDVIERLCIEAALETTGDNRASAAEMLGLSRQSLYVKMRRYGLSDNAANG